MASSGRYEREAQLTADKISLADDIRAWIAEQDSERHFITQITRAWEGSEGAYARRIKRIVNQQLLAKVNALDQNLYFHNRNLSPVIARTNLSLDELLAIRMDQNHETIGSWIDARLMLGVGESRTRDFVNRFQRLVAAPAQRRGNDNYRERMSSTTPPINGYLVVDDDTLVRNIKDYLLRTCPTDNNLVRNILDDSDPDHPWVHGPYDAKTYVKLVHQLQRDILSQLLEHLENPSRSQDFHTPDLKPPLIPEVYSFNSAIRRGEGDYSIDRLYNIETTAEYWETDGTVRSYLVKDLLNFNLYPEQMGGTNPLQLVNAFLRSRNSHCDLMPAIRPAGRCADDVVGGQRVVGQPETNGGRLDLGGCNLG